MVKKLIIATLVAILFVVFLPYGIALYLSPQNTLAKSDAIVVVSGGDTDARISEGVRLYEQGWSKKIIFSGAAAEGDVSNALAMKHIAIDSGIPELAIMVEENSKTTLENARFTAQIIKKNNYKSIILVTSPYHQRRAYSLFRTELGDNFTIINHSAKDTNWSKRNWWDNNVARFLTFGEVSKLFVIFFQSLGSN
ncbi:MAG: YdcF family protein [bacterium]